MFPLPVHPYPQAKNRTVLQFKLECERPYRYGCSRECGSLAIEIKRHRFSATPADDSVRKSSERRDEESGRRRREETAPQLCALPGDSGAVLGGLQMRPSSGQDCAVRSPRRSKCTFLPSTAVAGKAAAGKAQRGSPRSLDSLADQASCWLHLLIGFDCGEADHGGRLSAMVCTGAGTVAEGDRAPDARHGLWSGLPGEQADAFLLRGPPQAFDENAVKVSGLGWPAQDLHDLREASAQGHRHGTARQFAETDHDPDHSHSRPAPVACA